MYSTADAAIRTEVRADRGRRSRCAVETCVTYRWAQPVRWSRGRARDERVLAPVGCVIQRGDRLALREAWDALFDYVVGIQLNAPVSMTWELHLGSGVDPWLQGAVQTLVEVVGAEVGAAVAVAELRRGA